MLIVSQTKKTVVNLETMESVVAGDDNTIRAFPCYYVEGDDMYYSVGAYESETKAKSVMNQLWSAYANGEKVFIMP